MTQYKQWATHILILEHFHRDCFQIVVVAGIHAAEAHYTVSSLQALGESGHQHRAVQVEGRAYGRGCGRARSYTIDQSKRLALHLLICRCRLFGDRRPC